MEQAVVLTARPHFSTWGSWNFLQGNPARYLTALRDGMNRNAEYPPDRIAKPKGKYECDRFVAAEGGRVPATFAFVRNGQAEDTVSGTTYSLNELLRRLPRGHYFCKPDRGTHGAGAMHIELLPERIKIDDVEGPLAALEEAIGATDYLIQEWIVPLQHPLMARFAPKVINTVRLVTFDMPEGPVVRRGTFRAAVDSRSADNWTAGGVCTLVDVANGVLGAEGVVKGVEGHVAAHPRTGVAFEGAPLPHFREAVDLVQRLHSRLPAKTLGWDLALLKDGPLVLEVNRGWGMVVGCYFEPRLTTEFLDYHIPPHERTVRLEFRGRFERPLVVANFLCELVGNARLSGRLDALTAEKLVLTVASSHALVDAFVEGLNRPQSVRWFASAQARRVQDEIRRGLDLSPLFPARLPDRGTPGPALPAQE
jgi:hypothetical protein